MSSGPDRGQDEVSDELRDLAARAFAKLIATTNSDVIRSLAHNLCGESICCPIGSCSPMQRRRCALARSIESMHAGQAIRTLAELRVFARLSLAECSELTSVPLDDIVHRWRVTRALLFPRARQLLRECRRHPREGAHAGSPVMPRDDES
ncbi:MAG: hypothetical protein U1F60_13985 [Planctomycetota bacterium]